MNLLPGLLGDPHLSDAGPGPVLDGLVSASSGADQSFAGYLEKKDLKGKRSTFKVSKNLTHTVDLLLSFIVHNGDIVQGLRISEPNSPLMLCCPDCFHRHSLPVLFASRVTPLVSAYVSPSSPQQHWLAVSG